MEDNTKYDFWFKKLQLRVQVVKKYMNGNRTQIEVPVQFCDDLAKKFIADNYTVELHPCASKEEALIIILWDVEKWAKIEEDAEWRRKWIREERELKERQETCKHESWGKLTNNTQERYPYLKNLIEEGRRITECVNCAEYCIK